jgi:hypothetical protein
LPTQVSGHTGDTDPVFQDGASRHACDKAAHD